MPAALYADMERQTTGPLEDQRALQLALELSMLGLQTNDNTGSNGLPVSHGGVLQGVESLSPGQFTSGQTDLDQRNSQKKSQNTTECVPVPSSEHVAEIVGRQGCKIKALRAKTNTYIKTPVRGEEPVFVVTGRKEDVNAAKREILSAAEHFSSIRAQRKNNGLTGSMTPGPNSTMPVAGQTTIHVRVPYRVVGLVVGPKGATIKRIQQQTNTYIVTPSREKEPVFEVTGLPENVETARKEIEAHIAMRTGGSLNDHGSIGSTGEDDMTSAFNPSAASMTGLDGTSLTLHDPVFAPFASSLMQTTNQHHHHHHQQLRDQHRMDALSATSSFPFPSKLYPSLSLYENDDVLADSPPFDALGPVWPDLGSRLTTSSGGQSSQDGSLDMFKYGGGSGTGSLGTADRVSPTDSLGSAGRGGCLGSVTGNGGASGAKLSGSRECVVCFESEIVAALVPCGHNLFCLECANRIVGKPNAECPVCHQSCRQAMRIYN